MIKLICCHGPRLRPTHSDVVIIRLRNDVIFLMPWELPQECLDANGSPEGAGDYDIPYLAELAPPKRRQRSGLRGLGRFGQALGTDVALAGIDGDEDLAGPLAGSLVLPAVVTELAGDVGDDASAHRLG
jgi:hypothetical protein